MWMPLLITLVIALVLSSIGFKNYVWFISIGYGAAIAGIGIYLAIMGLVFPGIVLAVYGLRLSGYITYREICTSYNKKMKGEIKDGKTVSLGAKIAIWVAVAIQYACMVSPATFRYVEDKMSGSVLMYVALGFSILGLIIESAADVQKQLAKRKNPKTFVSTGLYKIVRCPNYFGEMLFWTGILVSGFDVFCNAGEWIIAILGWLLIIYTMFSGARRLEVRQNRVYKDDEAYWKYHDNTPIMLPLVPIYSVEKHTWLRA